MYGVVFGKPEGTNILEPPEIVPKLSKEKFPPLCFFK